jgi:hypothetical protein
MTKSNGKIVWHGRTGASRELRKILPPLRSIREVAKMMGLSHGAVFYIEKSALNKIVKELRAFYEKGCV